MSEVLTFSRTEVEHRMDPLDRIVLRKLVDAGKAKIVEGKHERNR